jgi:hypothetical protein
MKIEIDLDWLATFVNSNFFVALATFLSVLVVIWIYKRQKEDEKVKAAKIIWVEIADAENLLDNFKKNGIHLTNNRQIISVNSWNKHKHLFAHEFDERELKLIDNFYTECELINRELDEAYNLPVYWQDKARLIAEKHINFSENSKNLQEYEIKKASLKLFEEDTYWWQPSGPKQQMIERVKLTQYVSSTQTGEKLKKIAQLT